MPYHAVRRPTLTEADADAFACELAGLRAVADPDLALDLSAVEFLSSMALSRFVVLNWEVRACGGRLSLFNVRPAVRRVFVAARLDTLFDVRAAA
jgi:anti-anti-sigma factor